MSLLDKKLVDGVNTIGWSVNTIGGSVNTIGWSV